MQFQYALGAGPVPRSITVSIPNFLPVRSTVGLGKFGSSRPDECPLGAFVQSVDQLKQVAELVVFRVDAHGRLLRLLGWLLTSTPVIPFYLIFRYVGVFSSRLCSKFFRVLPR